MGRLHLKLKLLVKYVIFSDWLQWNKFQQHHEVQNFVEAVTFPCFAVILVVRKPYKKMQLNIQYRLY